MAVGAGKFQLYTKIDPVMSAGDYRFVVDQQISGAAEATPVDTLQSHVRVRAPRYQLPPDQVLSTFPPAGSEGAYGSRLPQVVVKRRTLPWERDLAGQPSATPWLALVLLAEGEGTLELNQPVADCVTPGVTLAGVADTKLGSCLEVRESVVHRVFPTRKDVPLLAHARQVDINDTELMMGDDDGYLSVVIANRLPLGGRAADGAEAPVKYLACLVNLEGQFDRLLPQSPPRLDLTTFPIVTEQATMSVAQYDQATMSGQRGLRGGIAPLAADDSTRVTARKVTTTGTPPYTAATSWSLEQAERTSSNIYAEMAADFSIALPLDPQLLDPVLRFPVLLHWSFVSVGEATFERLMRDVDSGLVGTVPTDHRAPEGRQPVEVVETGHVGLAHRTRRGDVVRSWYRGPVIPHPHHDADVDRLPLAHVSDQLRIVIPDGREDVSLASAFEVGRLLALSRPSVVAALLQWRQTSYHVARRRAIWTRQVGFLRDLLGDVDLDLVDERIGVLIGRAFTQRLAGAPDDVIGSPRPLVDPGRPLEIDADVRSVVATGFGIGDVDLSGDLDSVLAAIRRVDRLPGTDLALKLPTRTVRDALHRVSDRRLVDLVANTLDLHVEGLDGIDPVILGPTFPGTVTSGLVDGGPEPLAERVRARRTEREEDGR